MYSLCLFELVFLSAPRSAVIADKQPPEWTLTSFDLSRKTAAELAILPDLTSEYICSGNGAELEPAPPSRPSQPGDPLTAVSKGKVGSSQNRHTPDASLAWKGPVRFWFLAREERSPHLVKARGSTTGYDTKSSTRVLC